MSEVLAALPFLVAGAALGLIHFGALAWNVTLFTTGRPRALAIAVFAARLAISVAGFVVTARYGALPLVFAAVGFAAVRPLVVRLAKTAT